MPQNQAAFERMLLAKFTLPYRYYQKCTSNFVSASVARLPCWPCLQSKYFYFREQNRDPNCSFQLLLMTPTRLFQSIVFLSLLVFCQVCNATSKKFFPLGQTPCISKTKYLNCHVYMKIFLYILFYCFPSFSAFVQVKCVKICT